MPTAKEPLAAFEDWFVAQCDGDWEHGYGISIETLDNPGWQVRIDLQSTADADRTFDRQETHRGEDDWLVCWSRARGSMQPVALGTSPKH